MNDMVNHPNHYTSGSIECIDALEAMIESWEDPVTAFLAAQTVKYIWRLPFKENPVQDAEKAEWYLKRLREHLSGDDEEVEKAFSDDSEKVVIREGENCPGCEHKNDWCPGRQTCLCCDYDHKEIDEFPCCICSHNGGSENLWQHTIPIGEEIIEREY